MKRARVNRRAARTRTVSMHGGVLLYPSTTFEQGLLGQALLAAGLWSVVTVVVRRSASSKTVRRLLRLRGREGST
jgi:hypothetical protein